MNSKKYVTVPAALAFSLMYTTPAFAATSNPVENVFTSQMISVEKTLENVFNVIQTTKDSIEIEIPEQVEQTNEVIYQPEVTYAVEYVSEPVTTTYQVPVEIIMTQERVDPVETNDAQIAYEAALAAYNEALAAYESASQTIETTKEIEVEVVDEIEDEEGNIITETRIETQTVSETTYAGDVDAAQINLDAALLALQEAETNLTIQNEQQTNNNQIIIEDSNSTQESALESSGTIDSITWNLNEDTGELVFEGSGVVPVSDAWGKSFTSIVFNDGITGIADGAFEHCYLLEEIQIAGTVENIGNRAFHSCSSLQKIAMQPGVKSIGDYAFDWCYFLQDITLPDTITAIGANAFDSCQNIVSVTLPESLTSIEEQTFYFCSALESIEIPNSVTNIGNKAFYYCDNLKSVTIPVSVTQIEEAAFEKCGLTDIYYEGTRQQWNNISKGNSGIDSSITMHFIDDEPVVYVTDAQHSLSLEGDIGVNFYYAFTDAIKNDPGARVKFKVGDDTVTVFVKDAAQKVVQGVTFSSFTVDATSVQMTTDIEADVLLSNGKSVYNEIYHVKDYCDHVLASSTYPDQLKTLVKALLNYGGYAQIQFNANTDNLANKDLDDIDVSDVTTNMLKPYERVVSGSQTGISLAGTTLTLESCTTIKHYFKVEGGHDFHEFTFKMDGNELTPVQSGSLYYVEIPNITSKDLDTAYTVTVGNYSIRYSGLSYAYAQLNKSTASESLKNACRALYKYNQASNAYFS